MKLFHSLLVVGALLIAGSSAFAQNFEKEPFQNLSGTIKGAAPGGVQVAVSEKEVWIIHLDKDIKQQDIVFSGTAEKSFLRAGMFVELRAQINKRGTVLEPVASLTVYTPSDARPPGVLPDGAGAGAGANELFAEGKEEKKEEKKPDPKEKKAKAVKSDDTIYRIAGAVGKVGRGGEVTVNADGKQVKFNLAEECKITVDLNDISFVSAGDKAVVQGYAFKGQMGEGWASKIEVTAANPLTDGNKKKPTKPVKETKPSAKGAKGEKGEKAEKGEKEEKPAEEKKEEPKKDGEAKGAEKSDSKVDKP